MAATTLSNHWKWHGLKHGTKSMGSLVVRYEVNLSSLSDDYAPADTEAEELLARWINAAAEKHPDGLVSISWFVECTETSLFEGMPFQSDASEPHFLTRFSWPIHAETSARLDWLSLPVEDLGWREGRSDKGGFIQEATGWKPSILQPSVHLALFRDARG